MKILIIANVFHNFGRSYGGGGDLIIKKTFNKNTFSNFDIDLLSNKDGLKYYSEDICFNKSFLIPNFILKLPILISYLFRSFYALRYIKEFNNYNLIYLSSDFIPDVLPIFIHKIFLKKKFKLISSVFHLYEGLLTRKSSLIYNYIGFKCQRFSFMIIRTVSDKTMVINNDVKNKLINKFSFDTNKVFLNYPGIDIIKTKKKYKKEKYFLYVGRIAKTKGIDDLVHIIENLKKIYQITYNLKLVGSGDPEYLKELNIKIKKLDISNQIEFLGFVEDFKKFELLEGCLAMIMPSHEEGFSIIIGEALGVGVPVIAWDLEIYKEVYENNLFYSKSFDNLEMSKKIYDLIINKSLRESKIENGVNFVKKYNWDYFSKIIYNNYLSI